MASGALNQAEHHLLGERQLNPRVRALLGAAAVLSAVIGVVPPIGSEARRYVFVGALQFALFALVVPAFVVLAAPFARLATRGPIASVAVARRRATSFPRALGYLVCAQVVAIAWRTPAAVDALVHHGWLAGVELVTLGIAGALFWLELVDSAPFSPRSPRQRRIVLATLAMWSMWAIAYVVGLSHAGWYSAYAHLTGRALSIAADQQIMAGLLWAIAALVFLPVIFSNLMNWLRDEQDPDEELRSLTREERRRARWNPTTLPGGSSS